MIVENIPCSRRKDWKFFSRIFLYPCQRKVTTFTTADQSVTPTHTTKAMACSFEQAHNSFSHFLQPNESNKYHKMSAILNQHDPNRTALQLGPCVRSHCVAVYSFDYASTVSRPCLLLWRVCNSRLDVFCVFINFLHNYIGPLIKFLEPGIKLYPVDTAVSYNKNSVPHNAFTSIVYSHAGTNVGETPGPTKKDRVFAAVFFGWELLREQLNRFQDKSFISNILCLSEEIYQLSNGQICARSNIDPSTESTYTRSAEPSHSAFLDTVKNGETRRDSKQVTNPST